MQNIAPTPPTKRMQVLLVDDDAELATMVLELLAREGIEARHADNAAAGLAALRSELPDVLLLDVMLPDANGLDLCRQLRGQGSNMPIIMLTARGDPMDRVLGLELGADDYLSKPFDPRELVARLRALARRGKHAVLMADRRLVARTGPPSQANSQARTGDRRTLLRFGELAIDLLARRVSCGGETLLLTSTEFKLLAALAGQPGTIFDREALSAAVQPGSYAPLDRAVDVQVARLRKKLRQAPGGADWIDTVRGEGYVFTGRGP